MQSDIIRKSEVQLDWRSSRTLNNRTQPWTLVLVLLLLIAGSALRVHQIDGKGMWSDELFSTSIALHRDAFGKDQIQRFRRTHWQRIEDSDTFWTAKAADQSPPLFDLLAKVSTQVLGPTEVAMRMPSLIASVLLLTYLGYQSLRAREKRLSDTYLLLLMLFTASAAAIEYAQEARNYSLGFFLSAILCTLLYKRLQTGLTTAPLPGWPEIGLLVLACYTHYNLIAFTGILLLLYLYLAYRRGDWSSARRLFLVPLACVPWLLLSWHTVLLTASSGVGWAQKMDLGRAILHSLYAYYELLGKNFLLAALLLAVAYAAKRLVFRIRSIQQAPDTDILILVGVGVAYLLIASKIASMASLFHPRYLLFALPIMYLIVTTIAVRLIPWRLGIIVVGAILASTQVPLVKSYFALPKEGYREAAQWLLPRIDAESVVVTTWWPNRDYYRFYLEKGANRSQLLSISSAEEAIRLCEHMSTTRHVGIVAHKNHRDLVNALTSTCGNQFERTESSIFKDIFAQQWTRIG